MAVAKKTIKKTSYRRSPRKMVIEPQTKAEYPHMFTIMMFMIMLMLVLMMVILIKK